MTHKFRQLNRQPLWIIALLWQLPLLAPFVKILPMPVGDSAAWRQEFVLAAVLCFGLAILVKRFEQVRVLLQRLTKTEILVALPLLLFTLWSLASALWAVSAYAAIYHTAVWCLFSLFFLLTCFVISHPRLLHYALMMLVAVVGVISLLSICEYWAGSSLEFRRLGYGEPLAASIPLFTALALGLRRRRAAAVCGAVAVLAWLSILLLIERGAFIGACAALLFLFCAPLINARWRPRSLWRTIALVALFSLAVWVATYHAAVENTSVVSRINTASTNEESTATRLLFWGIALEEFRAHPWRGVGANNYEVAFPTARTGFINRYPDLPFIGANEHLLAERAHNEYLQILAELGIVGCALLAPFAVALMWLAWRIVRRGRSFLALGACGSLLSFALTSGVTSGSFRWTGSALIFFFAAALVTRFGTKGFSSPRSASPAQAEITLPSAWTKPAAYASLALTFAIFCGFCFVAANQVSLGMSQSETSPERATLLARRAYQLNPYDAATNFNLGAQYHQTGDAERAVPHLRFATERGYNVVLCYAALAMAETAAGDGEAAEKTLAHGAEVYPRSIFIRTRHAYALLALNRHEEAAQQLAIAEKLGSRAAKGWWELHNNGADSAALAARADEGIAPPRELFPEDCVLLIAGDYKK